MALLWRSSRSMEGDFLPGIVLLVVIFPLFILINMLISRLTQKHLNFISPLVFLAMGIFACVSEYVSYAAMVAAYSTGEFNYEYIIIGVCINTLPMVCFPLFVYAIAGSINGIISFFKKLS